MKPPVTVRVKEASWETVIEIPGIYGNAAGVAARLRAEGMAAKKAGDEVWVNANAEFQPRNL